MLLGDVDDADRYQPPGPHMQRCGMAPMSIVCDLDGVVWDGSQFINGSVDGLELLHRHGCEIWYVTNNSSTPAHRHCDRHHAAGAPQSEHVVTSAESAAAVMHQGDTILVVGGRGIHVALHDRGCTTMGATDLDPRSLPHIDAVVVGIDPDISYHTIWMAQLAILNGARLIGTNPDTSFPSDGRIKPGGGAILAAIAAASGTEPTITGKPYATMADLWRRSRHDVERPIVMIGDRRSTDGAFAVELGAEFILVSSRISDSDLTDVPVHHTAVSLHDAASFLVSEG